MHNLYKVMLLLVIGVLHAPCLFSQQVIKVQGRVTDENEKPFPYVNIFLTNSKTGTVTNNNGAFSVSFSGKEDVLNASFIGYETQTMRVDGRTGSISIQLKPSLTQLDEFVVSNLSAAGLLKKAVEKIPDNYPIEPVLLQTYYRAKGSLKDTLIYMEETAFNIVKSYKPSFTDEYFLVRNRNFYFKYQNRFILKGVGSFDIVKRASELFDAVFFRRYDVRYLPGSTFDNRYVFALEFSPNNKRKGNSGRIFIDAEDLAFVRFDLDFESGDKRYAQYKKIDDTYYLMDGYSKHINRHIGREPLPAEGNMVTTNIIHTFNKEDIEGMPVSTEDVIATYATQSGDTLFWEKHNVLLPDSSILRALEKYEAVQKDSAAYKSSEQYAAYVKRLYTPNLSLIVSSSLTEDFSMFHHNSNSVNRYMLSFFQRNLRGALKQQLGIYFYTTLISYPLDAVMSEWLLLDKNGIRAKANPFMFNKYDSPYLYNVDNQVLSDFKNGNYGDFMRLHTVRNETHYVKSNMIEEELARIDLSNKNNWINYIQLYAVELLLHHETNIYNPFKKEVKQVDKPEKQQPLIIDRNRSWVKYLFNPDAEFQRHVQSGDLTDEEQKYLKQSAYWSWLNLVSPQMYGIPKFKLNAKNSFTFSLNYLRTPFGEQFGQNIWVMHNYNQLHGVFVKQYRNYEKATFGIGYKLYDLKLFGNAYVTTSMEAWHQPEDFRFMANSSFTGFHIGQLFAYQFLSGRYVERNNFSLFLGYDYKTRGYMPENFYLDRNFNVKAGFRVNMR